VVQEIKFIYTRKGNALLECSAARAIWQGIVIGEHQVQELLNFDDLLNCLIHQIM
jgi:hypothetical protein